LTQDDMAVQVYPVHTPSFILCSTLVSFYLLVILYGELLLKKVSYGAFALNRTKK
jgi:hypothetical protein